MSVVLDRRAGAHQIAVAIDVVDAADRRPVLVVARGAGRKAAVGARVGSVPVVVGEARRSAMRTARSLRKIELPGLEFVVT